MEYTMRFWVKQVKSSICSAATLDRRTDVGEVFEAIGVTIDWPRLCVLFQVPFGATLLPLYGLTECTGAAFAKLLGDFTNGDVGAIISWEEPRLESAPGMGADPWGNPTKGQVLIRGNACAKGSLPRACLDRRSVHGRRKVSLVQWVGMLGAG